MLAALLAVFAVFLLREPLLVFWRNRMAIAKYGRKQPGAAGRTGEEAEDARFSLWVYSAIALAAAIYLLAYLPVVPLLLLGSGVGLLTLAALYLTVHNYQRHPALQIATAIGLTSSSLMAYLAGRGQLETLAFWIWGLCTAHSTSSVLMVHARLESMMAGKKTTPAFNPARHRALFGQLGLLALWGVLAATGRPWLIAPFFPPAILHAWELWQFQNRKGLRIPMRRVGWMQLTASVAFCLLLIAVLR